ncbi:hypothetical protein L1987_32636 [Smallanthus sonchifolius]|uniref:Uncharacterized protein n=1 Tax=Smallanthus sonchifolius TaxID=185202 RepID=A0ACB9HQ47_9ASTR|nr:hypothetical protein L1987_32636 [Smallanthus sonchifolius]
MGYEVAGYELSKSSCGDLAGGQKTKEEKLGGKEKTGTGDILLLVAPSHATFSNGGLTRDMVGIMVKKEWNIQEEITLQWRDRAYTLLCKEDDDGWCPNWCKESPTTVMATPAPATVREQQEEVEKVPYGNLEPRTSQGSPPHGNFKSACMGINVTRTKEKKKHAGPVWL